MTEINKIAEEFKNRLPGIEIRVIVNVFDYKEYCVIFQTDEIQKVIFLGIDEIRQTPNTLYDDISRMIELEYCCDIAYKKAGGKEISIPENLSVVEGNELRKKKKKEFLREHYDYNNLGFEKFFELIKTFSPVKK